MAAAPADPEAPLRVAFFTDDFYPQSGGIARSVQTQIQTLRRLGHHVTLVAPITNLVHTGDCPIISINTLRLPGTPSYTCSLRFGGRQVRSVCDAGPFDVVHSHNERGALLLAARVARESGIAHVHTFHSNYAGTHATAPVLSGFNSLSFLPIAPSLLRAAVGRASGVPTRIPERGLTSEESRFAGLDWRNLARLARHVDAFTTPADFVRDAIVNAAHGALADRAHVITTGIADAFELAQRRRPIDERPFRFISCSRLGAEKRVDVLIRAFAGLPDAEAELVLLGTGPQEQALRVLAQRLAPGRVRFLGHIDDVDRLAGELADADAFVLASHRFDTQGLVLAEAAAAGVPILYCDDRLTVGVTGDNALLTKPSVAGLAAGMRTLMDDQGRLTRMREASRHVGRALGTTAMGERYVAVYREAMARARGRVTP